MGDVRCSSRNGIGDDDKAASDGADDWGRTLAFDTSVERFDINLRLFVSPKASEGGPSPSFRFTALLCVRGARGVKNSVKGEMIVVL